MAAKKVNENLTNINVLFPSKASSQGARWSGIAATTYLCTLPCLRRLKRGGMFGFWASYIGACHGAL